MKLAPGLIEKMITKKSHVSFNCLEQFELGSGRLKQT